MKSTSGDMSYEQIQQLRSDMVKHQLKERGIYDINILHVMSRIPRHLFVPGKHAATAYEDISQPM
jgi:protein-L-isoaspartate O-methyltransferase